jgi:hypothetical protein
MDDPIWRWLMDAWFEGGDLWGFSKFWQGTALWFLLWSFAALNFSILCIALMRAFRKQKPLTNRSAS